MNLNNHSSTVIHYAKILLIRKECQHSMDVRVSDLAYSYKSLGNAQLGKWGKVILEIHYPNLELKKCKKKSPLNLHVEIVQLAYLSPSPRR